jgi:hypothetical protein
VFQTQVLYSQTTLFAGFVPVQPEDHDDVNNGDYVREFASARQHKKRKDYAAAHIGANSLNVAAEMNSARAALKADLADIQKRLVEQANEVGTRKTNDE